MLFLKTHLIDFIISCLIISAIGVSKGPIDYYPSSVFMCDCVCAFFKNIVKLTIQELVLAIHITAEPSLQARSIFCAVDGSSSNIDSLQSSGKTTEGQLR
uniref:Uncharacterized protein n=1 Tax=Arundo donax TaxID=35708 RepID=A0A0A8Z327_ARUDO